MRKTLNFNGAETEFCSSAATPILFKQVFKKDLLISLSAIRNEEDKTSKNVQLLDLIKELAYIMHAEAVGGSLFNTLTYDGYIKWLMSCDTNAFDDGAFNEAIIKLWRGNSDSSSESKNAQSQPQENSIPQSTC